MNRIVLSLAFLLFPFVAVHGQTANKSSTQTPSKKVVVSDIHGTELLHFCNMDYGTNGFQFCEAFIVGVRDGVVLAAELQGATPIIETPAEAKQEQLKAVVLRYLNEHSEDQHKPAALLVILALSQAFPPQEKVAK